MGFKPDVSIAYHDAGVVKEAIVQLVTSCAAPVPSNTLLRQGVPASTQDSANILILNIGLVFVVSRSNYLLFILKIFNILYTQDILEIA